MATNFFKIKKGQNLDPTTGSTVTVKGDIAYNSSTDKLELYNGAADPLVNESKAATLSNKTLDNTTVETIKDANFTIQDDGDITKQVKFQASGITTGNTRTLTVPDASTTIAGTDATQTLTNKTLDNTNTVTLKDTLFTVQDDGDVTKQMKFQASGITTGNTRTLTIPDASTTIVGTDATQTLSNKTFGDSQLLTEIATPATPSAGLLRFYAKTDDKLYTKNSAGTETQVGSGSSSSINYISANPDFESATTGYATYADAAGTSPVDGTGGSPTTTITRTTSSPLRGTGSGLITKDAANRQGEGVSYAFTIDSADQAKVLNISFDYAIASGTFVSGDLSDLRMFMYDVTNAILIPVTPFTIQGGSTGNFKFTGVFQTASNSTSYRLIWHIATTSASAWTFKFDNVIVGPQIVEYGAPVTDWTSYTLTVGATTTPPTKNGSPVVDKAMWRRVGDSMEVVWEYSQTSAGSAGSGTYLFPIPSGYTIDTAKVTVDTGSDFSCVGHGYARINATALRAALEMMVYDTSNVAARIVSSINNGTSIDSSTIVNSTSYDFSNANQKITFFFRVPITGWSSTVVMSNDTDTRIVAARYTSTSTASITTTPTIIDYATKDIDTHGAVTTGASWKYTVQVSGIYEVTAAFQTSNTASANNSDTFQLGVYKNGSLFEKVAYTTAATTSGYRKAGRGTTILNLVAGDFIDARISVNDATASHTLAAFSSDNITAIEIRRLSGPSAIAASEKVYLQYTSSGSTVLTADTTDIDWITKVVDSHLVWDQSTKNKFTAPRAGFYQVQCGIQFTASVSPLISLYVNGTKKITMYSTPTSTSIAMMASSIYLLAGDVLSVRTDTGSTLNPSATRSWISISSQG